ncbi:MAG: tetratricopeptide repeat protein, partial [Pseudomonadota bacterium]
PNAYEHYLRAELLFQNNKRDQAISELRNSLAFDPDSPYLHTRLAQFFVDMGNFKDAQNALTNSLKKNPSFPDALLLLGELAEQQGKWVEAEKHFKRCIDQNPYFSPTYLQYSNLLVHQHRLENARHILDEFVKKAPNENAIYLQLGRICILQLDYSCAAQKFAEALRIKVDANTLSTLAHVQKALGKTQTAINLLRESLENSGGNLDIATELIEMLLDTKQHESISDLLGVLERTALDDEDRSFQMIQLWLLANKPSSALSLIRTLEEQKQMPSQPLQLLKALALEQADQIEDAKIILLRELRGPHWIQPSLSLARLLGRKEGNASSTKFLRETIRTRGAYPELILELANTLSKQKEFDAAIKILRDAPQHHATQEDFLFSLAAILEKSGRWKDAIQTAKKIVEKKPKSAPAHNFIGYVQVNNRVELDSAEKSLKKAFYLQPGASYIIDSLAWLAYRKGQLQEAVRLLTLATNLSPQEPEILKHLSETLIAAQKKQSQDQRTEAK